MGAVGWRRARRPGCVFGKAWTTPALAVLTGLALVMAIPVGRFAGFLNLSTLQSFYASRLTRAYLGASNGNRFSRHGGQPRGRGGASAWPSPPWTATP